MRWPKSWGKCCSKVLCSWAFLQGCKPTVPTGKAVADTFAAPSFLVQEDAVAAWQRWRQQRAAEIRPHVYRLEVRVRYPYGYETYRGTAWRWHPEGCVVTCRHLLPGQKIAEVELWDETGACLSARVVWRDSIADVAFLQVAQRFDAVPPHRTGEMPPIGTTVLAYGAPWGLLGSLAEGFISGENRYLASLAHPFLQLSIPAQPGSSGSPVLDREGYAVGMISDIAGASGIYEGLTFAIPMQVLEQAWERYRSFASSHETPTVDTNRQ